MDIFLVDPGHRGKTDGIVPAEPHRPEIGLIGELVAASAVSEHEQPAGMTGDGRSFPA
ncbi:MAG: hypothetical protein J0H84_19660 [Rhizobiales bacterium]|jgi:hypothetical protein|nr:hypothetical protein [Hyphomicrobiales bacterium]